MCRVHYLIPQDRFMVSVTTKPKLFNISKKENIPDSISNDQNVMNRVTKIAKSFLIIFGIYSCYITSSYYQEKLSVSYTRVINKDSMSIFLILILYFSNSLSGLIYLLVVYLYNKVKFYSKNETHYISNSFSILNKKAIQKLILVSLSLTGSAMASTLALKHITFPTQVLVKSGKMIPIVLGSYLIFGKKYDSFEYIMVIIITLSLVFFNIFKTFSDNSNKKTLFGIGLCFISLIFDSYTGPSQEQILTWCKLDPITMMVIVNAFSFLMTFLVSILFGMEAFNIVMYDPFLRINVFFHTITASIGQFFMYYSIHEFGSLYTCIITTTRKAVTTLISIYFFGHKISVIQWVCIFAIFSTLLAQQFYKANFKVKKA